MRVEDWRGLSFIDAGCGMGRNSYWPMCYGATRGLAIDVDCQSLTSARRTLLPFPSVTIRELSIYDLQAGLDYDVAFSIGVLHHLQDPLGALRAMVGAVKPGGKVLIWVYGLENNGWIVNWLTPMRRLFLSWMPISLVHHLSIYPTLVLWLFLRLTMGRTEYFRQLRGFTFRHVRSIVFDQMLPKIANYWSRADVEKLMTDAGLAQIELAWVNEMSWAACGIRPAEH
jgi:SAM-dependent methyltransferase